MIQKIKTCERTDEKYRLMSRDSVATFYRIPPHKFTTSSETYGMELIAAKCLKRRMK